MYSFFSQLMTHQKPANLHLKCFEELSAIDEKKRNIFVRISAEND